MPASLFPILLAIHIALAISLVLPSIVLPFALRARQPAGDGTGAPNRPEPVVAGLLWLQAHGTLVIGIGLAVTGAGLLTTLGTQLLSQPWLLLALGIYAANLLLAFFVQRPNLRRLLGGGDEATWRRRARRQRYVSYAMAGLVGTIAFLMSTKPALW